MKRRTTQGLPAPILGMALMGVAVAWLPLVACTGLAHGTLAALARRRPRQFPVDEEDVEEAEDQRQLRRLLSMGCDRELARRIVLKRHEREARITPEDQR